ncbi:TIGR00730 family Rossman fold protein [Streptomyces collinus]|uniref:LOG family protein n=1 Tax=Streptomyces collinus TaxID=42684 RepID=UPI0029439F68|nr:TIGR00730 family Rossman fold protein [Streptomyces collinus]
MAVVCVFCSASPRIPESYRQVATEVGLALASAGHTVLTGGGSRGAMGAVTAAARAAGGGTVGILPTGLLDREIPDPDTELHLVPSMERRKELMGERSDAFVVLPGGIGTLDELFGEWANRAVEAHDKPIVIVDPDGLFTSLRQQIDLLAQKGLVRGSALTAVKWAASAAEVVDFLPPTISHSQGMEASTMVHEA